MGKINCKSIKNRDIAAIGIGAMIVFIAMVLVAGIAASVLVQTSTKLESQAMTTGHQTTDEVATGLAVFSIEGYAATSADISKLAITIRPRAGSTDIDLSQAFVEISDTGYKIILNYTTTYFVEDAGDGKDNIFGQSFFPSTTYQFGLLVLEDADDSCNINNPVINKGDKVIIGIDTSQVFSNIAGGTDIWGMVVPEVGSPGVIKFKTPSSYAGNILELQ